MIEDLLNENLKDLLEELKSGKTKLDEREIEFIKASKDFKIAQEKRSNFVYLYNHCYLIDRLQSEIVQLERN